MSKQENKQTVLDSIYAFDASTAVMESIMSGGEVQYGLEDNDNDDLITTDDGDTVVNPARMMYVKVSDPMTTGPQFMNEVEPMSEEDKAFYIDEFTKKMMNLHKNVITDDMIEGVAAAVQMDADTIQDVTGFIKGEVENAKARLSGQNSNEVLNGGVATDMTGDGVEFPTDGPTDDAEQADFSNDGKENGADNGFSELKPTTFLTPEDSAEDKSEGLGDIDIGLDNSEDSAADNDSNPFANDELWNDNDDDVNPFDDLNMGGDSEEKDESAENEEKDESTENEEKDESAENEEKDESAENEAADDNAEVDSNDGTADSEDDDDAFPINESINLDQKAMVECADALYKRCQLKARCESIVQEANRKLAEKNRASSIKAQCESIIADYKATKNRNVVKAKLESILNDFRDTKVNDVKAQCEAIVSNYHKNQRNHELAVQIESMTGVDDDAVFPEEECTECGGKGCEACNFTGRTPKPATLDECSETPLVEGGDSCVDVTSDKFDTALNSLNKHPDDVHINACTDAGKEMDKCLRHYDTTDPDFEKKQREAEEYYTQLCSEEAKPYRELIGESVKARVESIIARYKSGK